MLTVKEVEQLFSSAENDGEDYPEGFTIVSEGEWEQEHKYQTKVTVYSFTDNDATQFFEVTQGRTGACYSDWDYLDQSIMEVVPTVVTKTIYVKK